MKKLIVLAILASTMIPPCGMLHAKMSKKEKKQVEEVCKILIRNQSEIIDYVGYLERKVDYLQRDLDKLYEMHDDYDPDESKCDKY